MTESGGLKRARLARRRQNALPSWWEKRTLSLCPHEGAVRPRSRLCWRLMVCCSHHPVMTVLPAFPLKPTDRPSLPPSVAPSLPRPLAPSPPRPLPLTSIDAALHTLTQSNETEESDEPVDRVDPSKGVCEGTVGRGVEDDHARRTAAATVSGARVVVERRRSSVQPASTCMSEEGCEESRPEACHGCPLLAPLLYTLCTSGIRLDQMGEWSFGRVRLCLL